MGGFDVVALRSICESYAERHILPMLRELQAAQGELAEKLKHVEEGSALAQSHAVLQERVALKADLDMVPSMEQFEAGAIVLAVAAMFLRAPMVVASTTTSLPTVLIPLLPVITDTLMAMPVALMLMLTDQLNVLEKNLPMAMEKELCRTLERHGAAGPSADLETRLAARLDELEAALQAKADAKDVVTADQLEALSDLVSTKANFRDVASAEQLKRLAATVERKAFANKVPSLQQWQDLEKAVANKVDAVLVPTLAQVEELADQVKRKNISAQAQEEVRKVSAELQRKADASDILAPAQIERLVKEQVERLVARKADVSEVPSMTQHKELAGAMERKLSFLATKVQQRSEAMREMCQQPQTVWCVQPAVVDVSWDENGQAWPEWNPSQMMPCSGGGDGFQGNIFVPQHMFANQQCAGQPPKQDGAVVPCVAVEGAGKAGELRRMHSGSTSAASSASPTPPSQEPAQEV